MRGQLRTGPPPPLSATTGLGAVIGGAIGVRVALRHGRSDRDHLLGLAIGAVAGGLLAIWIGWRESSRHWPG